MVHGGLQEGGKPVDDTACLWLWDVEQASWGRARPATAADKSPAPRSNHEIFVNEKQNWAVIHGGVIADSKADGTETWLFDFETASWTELPSLPHTTLGSALVGTTLQTISQDSNLGGSIHSLDITTAAIKNKQLSWTKTDFPTNQLVPGPQLNNGGSTLPLTTGYGRYYLLHLLGSPEKATDSTSDKPAARQGAPNSALWALQLPSENISASHLKDVIRDAIPIVNSGKSTLSEIEITYKGSENPSGRPDPGQRNFFAADTFPDGKRVLLCGGVSSEGQVENDAWIVSFT